MAIAAGRAAARKAEEILATGARSEPVEVIGSEGEMAGNGVGGGGGQNEDGGFDGGTLL